MAQVDTKEGLPVTPTVVRWARERAGFSLEEAKKTFKRIEAWESGDAFPTYVQLEQLAEKLHCPVAVFFFPAPPAVPPIEPSFRTLTPDDFAAIPRTVRAFLLKAQAMQVNLAELSDGINKAKRLITRDLNFDPNASPGTIAEAVRKYLDVSVQQQSAWKGVDEALEQWRSVFANVGVFVFKDAFRAKDYFGFCLYNDEFPIIYVNNSSTKSRQIFTLFHELGHLLFRTSGIDVAHDNFIQHLPAYEKRIEIVCNALAAQILMPEPDFTNLLKDKPPNRATAMQLATHFNVSREAVYRKMLDRGLIAASEYEEAAELWKSQMKQQSDGGNYYNNQITYLGRRYIDLAVMRFQQGRFDETRLAEYLNIKPRSLAAFEEAYGPG